MVPIFAEGIPPARSFALEASFEMLQWRVSDAETPEDWRAYLARVHYARKHGEGDAG